MNANIDNENLKKELTNVKNDNDILVQKSTHITQQRRFNESRAMFTDFFRNRLDSVTKVKANIKTRRKLFTILTELLHRGEIPYDEIQQRFWKSKQNRARSLSYLRKLGYVGVKKKNKKYILILSPSGKNLESQFENMLGG